MDFSHDRMVIDHSIVVSIAKLSMLNFAIDTPISWSITTICLSIQILITKHGAIYDTVKLS